MPIMDYPRLFEKIDIGIVPLNNVLFNHAKSFIKGLEYAAAGVPFISSGDIPEYEYLASCGLGRTAKNSEEWQYHLSELLDPVLRREEVDHNYEVLEQFTMDKRAQDWVSVFEEIIAL